MFKNVLKTLLKKLGISPVPFVTFTFLGWTNAIAEERAKSNLNWLDAEINAGRLGPKRPDGLFKLTAAHEPTQVGDEIRVYFDPSRCNAATVVEYLASIGLRAARRK